MKKATKKAVTKKADKRKRGFYTEEDKIAILRYWDDHDMDASIIMARFNVARSTLFSWKRSYWEDMLEAKEAGISSYEEAKDKEKVSTIKNVAQQTKEESLKRKATKATNDILDLIIAKLERDKMIMDNDPDTLGIIKIHELSKLFEYTASFVIPKPAPEKSDEGETSFNEKYSRITQYIQNNYKINTDGNKKNTSIGNRRLVSINPRPEDKGEGIRPAEHETEE